MTGASTLHHTLVPAAGEASACALFLHGILGSGSNLRGVAQRFVRAMPGYCAVLVDLRAHGRSPDFEAPQTLDACAGDLCALEQTLTLPVKAVVGHSFGGKVALAYHRQRPGLERVALLDSAPFARPDRQGADDTLKVLAMLDAAPDTFDDRAAFLAYVEGHGQSRGVAEWLAMNLARNERGVRFDVDLRVIRALLDDYFATDLWSVLTESEARCDLVIGARSGVWTPDDVSRAKSLAQHAPSRVGVHVLPTAGHWVHVDDPEGLTTAITQGSATP